MSSLVSPPAAWAVADKPRCDVDAAQLADLRQGRSVILEEAPAAEALAVFGPDGELVALATLRSGRLCPTLVLAAKM